MKKTILEQCLRIFEMSSENLGWYEQPLVGIGSASDPLFKEFQKDDVIGPWHKLPVDWLPGAKTVISLFFPLTAKVKESNRNCTKEPSQDWLYSRIEGQQFINIYMKRLRDWLISQGIACCVPSVDEGFEFAINGKGISGYESITEKTFASNWSERHIAYVCGLGTFGLSKGLITEKGMAGRFASVIIETEFSPDERTYTGLYDYCTKCGACVRRCPVNAISLEQGKDHKICSDWLDETRVTCAPRYGCGLCQTKVPCESKIPGGIKI